MGRDSINVIIVLISILVFGVVGICNADWPLKKEFYKESCPKAEKLVRDMVRSKAKSNAALAAKLLRMHFHDCFVRGCDASILLDKVGSSPSEKDAVPNQSVSGYDVIDDIKTEIEKVCPNVVSCADILSLAARDAVSFQSKKHKWEVLTGRRDGNISLASDVTGNIPSPFSNFTTLMHVFTNKGLNISDLVALSGAHTIGVAHCGTFSRRLYNFTGKGDMDPSLNETYAQDLKTQCPNPANSSIVVEMDPGSSLSFDSHYFNILLQHKGLFVSDAALLEDEDSAEIVRKLQKSNLFSSEFAKSMEKMAAIEVLTGNDGEIRKKCNIVNPRTKEIYG